MAKTLRTLTSAGFTTKGTPLTNQEVDQNFIDLLTDIGTKLSKTGDTISGTYTGDHSYAGQVSFTNATAPIISSKIGPTSGQQHTIPATTSDTVVLLGASQALTNKTISGLTVSNTTATLALASGSTFQTNGAFSSTLTFSAATSITFPTTGTLVTLAGTETLTNKLLSTGSVWNGGVIGAIYGGTSFSTYATGDLIYASATNTLSKLAAGTNTHVLTLTGGVPVWAAPAVPTISDDNTGTTQFLVFATGTGAQALKIDSSTGPLSYVPSTGVLTVTGSVNINGGTIATTSATASIFDTNSTTVTAFGAGTTITMGNTSVSGTSTFNISTAANTSGTKTINIGTAGAAGSTTTITVGTTLGTSTLSLNSPTISTASASLTLFNSTVSTVTAFAATTSLVLGGNTAGQTITIGGASTSTSVYNYATGVTASGNTKTIDIGTNSAAGSTTTITIGSTLGTNTVTLRGSVVLTTALAAIYGGTAQTSYTTGDLLYASATNTLSKRAIGSENFVLTSISGVPTWAQAQAGVNITDDTSTNATRYVTFSDQTSGTELALNVASTKLTYNPFDGQLNSVVFNTTSDRRAKENIRALPYGLADVLSLQGRMFEMKDGGKTSIGFIADEIKRVIPEVVAEQFGGLEGVNYSVIVSVLVEAIKELNSRISSLESA